MANHTFTFLEQLNLLSTLLGDSQTTAEDMFPIADRKMYINRGEMHFALDSKCLREYATGSVASQEITLPDNWLSNFMLVVNGKKCDHLEVALQDYERYLNSGDYHWYQWDISDVRKIMFLSSAVGTSTYKLWYFKKPLVALDSNTDVSIIPIEYREASVYWAGWQLLQQIGKIDLANQCMQVYASFVQSAMADTKEKYLNRVNPNVDVGDVGASASDIDVQGRGYTY